MSTSCEIIGTFKRLPLSSSPEAVVRWGRRLSRLVSEIFLVRLMVASTCVGEWRHVDVVVALGYYALLHVEQLECSTAGLLVRALFMAASRLPPRGKTKALTIDGQEIQPQRALPRHTAVVNR